MFYVEDGERGEGRGERRRDGESDREGSIRGCGEGDLNLGWRNKLE